MAVMTGSDNGELLVQLLGLNAKLDLMQLQLDRIERPCQPKGLEQERRSLRTILARLERLGADAPEPPRPPPPLPLLARGVEVPGDSASVPAPPATVTPSEARTPTSNISLPSEKVIRNLSMLSHDLPKSSPDIDGLDRRCEEELFEANGLSVGELPSFEAVTGVHPSASSGSDASIVPTIAVAVGGGEAAAPPGVVVVAAAQEGTAEPAPTSIGRVPAWEGTLSAGSWEDTISPREAPSQLHAKAHASIRSLRVPTRDALEGLRTEWETGLLAATPSVNARVHVPCVPTGRGRGLPQLLHDGLLCVPGFIVYAIGVTPFNTGLRALRFQRLVLLSTAALLAHSLVQAALDREHMHLWLITSCYALSALLGLLHVGRQGIHELLGPHKRPLEAHAFVAGFRDRWRLASLKRCLVAVAAWACTVLAAALLLANPDCDVLGAASASGLGEGGILWSLVPFAAASGLSTALVYLILHVCSGLELVVDNFCVVVLDHQDFARGVGEWNLVQALLRRSARSIDGCFLAQGTAVLSAMLLAALAILQLFSARKGAMSAAETVRLILVWIGPSLAPVLLLLYSVFRAAALTEKCLRVPPLVNSWASKERPIDAERLFMVQHIGHSGAGFYVAGVRLNASMTLKLAYLLGFAAFTFSTHFILP